MEGTHIFGLASGKWDAAELRQALEDILSRDRSLVDYEISADFNHVGRKRLVLNARQLERNLGSELILLAEETGEGGSD